MKKPTSKSGDDDDTRGDDIEMSGSLSKFSSDGRRRHLGDSNEDEPYFRDEPDSNPESSDVDDDEDFHTPSAATDSCVAVLF